MSGAEMTDGVSTDAEALLASCRRRAGEARNEITLVAVALSCARRNDTLNDRQRAQLGNMLRRLVGETAATLHQALVAALEDRHDLRRESVAAFAASVPGAAFDRLVAAGVLFEPPLVEAALHRMFEHRLEVALRPSVADPWQSGSGAGEFVIAAPTGGGSDRQLAERLDGYVVERTRRTDGYGEPVLRFDELDAGIVERLHWHVAVILGEAAVALLDGAPGTIDTEMERVVASVLDAIAMRAAGASATTRAVDAIEAAGALDGALVVEALRQAEVPLFIALFARLARLRPTLLRRMVFEADGFALAILGRSAGLSEDQLETIFALTRHARTPARAFTPDDTMRLVALFGRIGAEDAQRVCDHWRLDRRYLDAMWRLRGAATGGRVADAP